MAGNQRGASKAAQDHGNVENQALPPTEAPTYAKDCCKTETRGKEDAPVEKPLPRFARPEWVIVYITAVYVGIAAVTFWAIWRQSRVMERQANTMERQAEEARESAAAAVTTAQNTLNAIERQTKATEDATKVAESNLLALVERERPRIHVIFLPKIVESLRPEFVIDKAASKTDDVYAGLEKQGWSYFQIDIENRGRTVARDVDVDASVSVTNEEKIAFVRPLWEGKFDLKPSRGKPFQIRMEVFWENQGILDRIHEGKSVVSFSGVVKYVDPYSIKPRITSFSYRWNADSFAYSDAAPPMEYFRWEEWPKEDNYTS